MSTTINLKNIKIRKLSLKDLKKVKEFQKLVNSLVEEESMILMNKKKTLKEEKEWLKENLKNLKKKKEVCLLIEDDGKIVGISDIKLRKERQNHVGEFGISIEREYRGMGLGRRLMAEILKLAKKN